LKFANVLPRATHTPRGSRAYAYLRSDIFGDAAVAYFETIDMCEGFVSLVTITIKQHTSLFVYNFI
jgi:hypothetical protein